MQVANKIAYKFGKPESFDKSEIDSFLELLKKQGKIGNPAKWKLLRCKLLGIGIIDGSLVSIGAIKPKTPSDFTSAKADLLDLAAHFEWEVGYFYTEPKYEGNRYSSNLLDGLITNYGSGNLMASTEIRENNRMINSLENRGFVQVGKSWASNDGNSILRLFLNI